MSMTIPEFWKLTVESQLMTTDEARQLHHLFHAAHPGTTAVEELVKFLVGKKLTPYQAKVLLAGRPGPFVYGDYVIYERIESGRMAGIFRALHRGTGHRVCLMFLSGPATQDPKNMAAVRRNVASVGRASVGHPHLMRCYHLVDQGDFKFIVLEDIEGKRVERLLSTGGPMGVSEACRIVRQAALGLSRLHQMGHIHDAIRPAHLWLEPNHNVKLLNYPLVGDPVSGATLLTRNSTVGKIPAEADYVAPELANAQQLGDVRSDIYSLGCTLYHMLAGSPPFAGGDLQQKLSRHLHEEPRPLNEVNAQVPLPLAKAVRYMLAKDPELRYQHATSVVEAILPFISAQDAQTKPVPPSPQAQAYEHWLARQLPTAETPAEPDVVSATAVPAQAVTPAQAVASVATPTATAPATMVAPLGAPVAGAPVAMAISAGAVAPPMAAPAMAQPVMAAPAMAQPVMAAPYSQQVAPFSNVASPAHLHADTDASVAPNPAMSRMRRRRTSKLPLVLGVLLLAGGGAALHFSGALGKILDKLNSPRPTVAANTTSSAKSVPGTNNPVAAKNNAPNGSAVGTNDTAMAANSGGATSPADSAPPNDVREQIYALKDDVWQSPTKGKALDAKYLAPGAQALVVLRPAELAKHPEGEKLLDHSVTGHLGDWIREELPKIAGLPLEKLEQVVISLLDGGAAPPIAAYRIRTTEPVAHEALVAAWGNPAPDESAAGKLVFQKDATSYYLPASGGQRLIVVGPSELFKDVIESDGAAAALPLELEVMLKQTDEQRSLSVLFVPRVMLADGKQVLTGPAKLWRGPLENFLLAGDGSGELPKAALASLHLGESLFVELRLFDATTGPQNNASGATIETRLKQLPRQLHQYLLEVPPSKYSLPVVGNFEEMLRQFVGFLRVGVGEKQVVARAYLPVAAAHNFAMSLFLATIDNPNSGYARIVQVAGGGNQPAAAAANLSPAETALAKVTSLSFERQPLDKTIELLSDDIGMPIMIDGPNLQIDGITKNQSINGLAEENKSAKEILKVVLAKANLMGKLCYVIVVKDGAETIYVTTKDGAKKNNWKLPPDFAEADPKKKA